MGWVHLLGWGGGVCNMSQRPWRGQPLAQGCWLEGGSLTRPSQGGGLEALGHLQKERGPALLLGPPLPPASLSLSSTGWWTRPRCPPGDAGRGPLHSPLRAEHAPLAATMARLAAALWSLCVTAILVTSATQGRC